MERLTGLDAAFLRMETPAHPMHTLKLLVLETGPSAAPDVQANVRALLRERLPGLEGLRRRVVEVPLGLHHPVWVDVGEVDLDRHLRHATVASPGTRDELDATVAEIAAEPLDRALPLWQMWTFDGLRDGRTALLLKIHHAVADGATVARLLATLSSVADGAPAVRAATAEPVPSGAALLGGAVRDHARQAARLPRLVGTTAARILELVRSPHARIRAPRPVLDTPVTSFNAPLSGERSLATASFSLTEARSVKRAFGVTLNDVVLAMVSGALRRYLIERGELPERSLVASVPTATERTEGRRGGNHVSSLFTTLATDVADPIHRLRAIHATAIAAKDVQRALGADLLEEWAAYAPPPVFGWLLHEWSAYGMARYVPAAINVIVSNVPGPTAPLALGGRRLESIYSVGPILEGIGLNVTVWSYLDELSVGVLGCRALLPEPRRIADGMGAALRELAARTGESALDPR